MIGTRIWAQNDTTQIVYLEHSETLSFDEQRLPDAWRLSRRLSCGFLRLRSPQGIPSES